MVENQYNKEKTKAGALQWALVIIISLVFAIILAIIIMTFAGVNVKEEATSFANRLPFLSEMVTTEQEQVLEDQEEHFLAEIQDKEKQLEQLTTELDSKEGTITELNIEIEKLNQQIEELTNDDEEMEERVKSVSSSFRNMDPEASAPILSKLDEGLAVLILESLPNDARGQILGQLDPEIAAKFTNELIQPNSDN